VGLSRTERRNILIQMQRFSRMIVCRWACDHAEWRQSWRYKIGHIDDVGSHPPDGFGEDCIFVHA